MADDDTKSKSSCTEHTLHDDDSKVRLGKLNEAGIQRAAVPVCLKFFQKQPLKSRKLFEIYIIWTSLNTIFGY